MKLSQIATIVPLVIVAIGLIGWILTVRNDVTSTIDQIAGIHAEMEIKDEQIDDLSVKIGELEKSLAISDDQMRTIMGEHEVIGEMFEQIGEIQPAGERREYGGYGK